jgi:hypothetical protein
MQHGGTMSKKLSIRFALMSALAFSFSLACSEEEEEPEPATYDPMAAKNVCKDGRICEAVSGAEGKCFDAYTIQGKVFDTVTAQPIKGARIVARDVNGAAVSGVAISNEEGNYKLPVPITRVDANGAPVETKLDVLLRADALGYVTFPKAPRTALPLNVFAADDKHVLKNAATDIGLVPVQDATGLGAISAKWWPTTRAARWSWLGALRRSPMFAAASRSSTFRRAARRSPATSPA